MKSVYVTRRIYMRKEAMPLDGVKRSIVWDDSKTTPHMELSLGDYTLSCDMTDADIRETTEQLLALAEQ